MKRLFIVLVILAILALGSSIVLADPYGLPDPEIKVIVHKS